jgi:hypothetical protein
VEELRNRREKIHSEMCGNGGFCMCMRLLRVVWMVRRIKRNENRFCVVNWVAKEGKTTFFHTRKTPACSER